MMVHRSKCDECGEFIDYLNASDEFEGCPFCDDGQLEFQGTMGCVTGTGDSDG